MKNRIALLLSALMLLTLCSCGIAKSPQDSATEPPASTPTQPTTPTEPVQPEDKCFVDTAGMTDLQKAVVVTAESYFLRSERAQYDMNAMASDLYRRTTGLKAPEDYTSQNIGYTDCSGFVFDVYKFALDLEICGDSPYTKNFCTSSPYCVLYEQPEKNKFVDLPAEKKAEKLKAFTDKLQPGDIIVYRYAKDSGGHAMLYVGNGMMIHSTGTSYNYSAPAECTEVNGTYRYEPIDSMFDANSSRYLLNKHTYVILRPLLRYEKEIPAQTQQRMGVMRGITAEKLCSHTYGQTVSPGEQITFTFRISNHSDRAKTLTVTDTVPANCTFLHGVLPVTDDKLCWDVTVQPGCTESVSYTVRVNYSTAAGTIISSESAVCGIAVNCPGIRVANNLTQEQKTALANALTEFSNKSLRGIDLVNALYEKICGKAVFTAQSTNELWDALVKPFDKKYLLDESLPLTEMVAPYLYGGRSIVEMDRYSDQANKRTRLVTAELLMTGDIILADNKLYLFTGDGLWNLDTNKATKISPHILLGHQKFVVLRPSMTFQ